MIYYNCRIILTFAAGLGSIPGIVTNNIILESLFSLFLEKLFDFFLRSENKLLQEILLVLSVVCDDMV